MASKIYCTIGTIIILIYLSYSFLSGVPKETQTPTVISYGTFKMDNGKYVPYSSGSGYGSSGSSSSSGRSYSSSGGYSGGK